MLVIPKGLSFSHHQINFLDQPPKFWDLLCGLHIHETLYKSFFWPYEAGGGHDHIDTDVNARVSEFKIKVNFFIKIIRFLYIHVSLNNRVTNFMGKSCGN